MTNVTTEPKRTIWKSFGLDFSHIWLGCPNKHARQTEVDFKPDRLSRLATSDRPSLGYFTRFGKEEQLTVRGSISLN